MYGPLDIFALLLSRLFSSPLSGILTLTIIVLVGRALIVWLLFLFQPKPFDALSAWSSCVWGLREDPQLFYRRVYQLLAQRLESSGIVAQVEQVDGEAAIVEKRVPLPLAKLNMSFASLFAGRSLIPRSAPYLRVRYRVFTYYVYASPLPGGLFVSSRLFWRFSNWEYKPLQMLRLWWHARRLTIFDLDAMEMFHTCLHQALLDVLDDYCREAAIPPLDAFTRRPILHGFYARLKGTSHLNVGIALGGTLPINQGAQPSNNDLTGRSVAERLPFEPPLETDHLYSAPGQTAPASSGLRSSSQSQSRTASPIPSSSNAPSSNSSSTYRWRPDESQAPDGQRNVDKNKPREENR